MNLKLRKELRTHLMLSRIVPYFMSFLLGAGITSLIFDDGRFSRTVRAEAAYRDDILFERDNHQDFRLDRLDKDIEVLFVMLDSMREMRNDK